MNQQMKVLIGYDGSSCANAALHDLRRAGLPQTVEAVVMCVADVLMPPQTPPDLGVEGTPFPASVPEATRQAWTRALRAIEEAEALAKQAGERLQTYFPAWKVCAEARADSPAWGLVKKADEWKPDLLVVGSHGRSALARLILGSVSQKVLTEARCSVWMPLSWTSCWNRPAFTRKPCSARMKWAWPRVSPGRQLAGMSCSSKR